MPNYGIFSRLHFMYTKQNHKGAAKKFSDMSPSHGPPGVGYKYSVEYDTLENNELLLSRGLTPDDVKHPNKLKLA